MEMPKDWKVPFEMRSNHIIIFLSSILYANVKYEGVKVPMFSINDFLTDKKKLPHILDWNKINGTTSKYGKCSYKVDHISGHGGRSVSYWYYFLIFLICIYLLIDSSTAWEGGNMCMLDKHKRNQISFGEMNVLWLSRKI